MALNTLAPPLLADGLSCPSAFSRHFQGGDDCVVNRAIEGDIAAQLELLQFLDRERSPESWPYGKEINSYGSEIFDFLDAGVARGDADFIEIQIGFMERLTDILQTRKRGIEQEASDIANRIGSFRPIEVYTSSGPVEYSREEMHQFDIEMYEARVQQLNNLGGSDRISELKQLLLEGGDLGVTGDVVAQILTAGDRSSENQQRILVLLNDAISLNNGVAEATLGFLYEEGAWVERDINRAIGYYQEGWRKGAAQAGYHIARHMLPGGELPTNEEAAYELLSGLKTRVSSQPLPELRVGESDPRWEVYAVINPLLGPLAYKRAAAAARSSNMDAAFDFYLEAAQAGLHEAQLAVAYLYRSRRLQPELSDYQRSGAESWEKLWFRNASNCTDPSRSTELCQQASAELQNIDIRIRDRRQAERERAYAILGLIGLALVGLGDPAGGNYDNNYQPPNIDSNAGIQMAAELMWLGKW